MWGLFPMLWVQIPRSMSGTLTYMNMQFPKFINLLFSKYIKDSYFQQLSYTKKLPNRISSMYKFCN